MAKQTYFTLRDLMRRSFVAALLLACVTPALLPLARQERCGAIDLKKAMRVSPVTQPAGPVEMLEAVDLPLKADGASGDVAKWLKPFEGKPEKFSYTRQLIADEDNLRFDLVVFPSPCNSPWPENNRVPCELYLPKLPPAKVPAAIVLDILDGSAIVPRAMSRGLAEQGVVAIYVPMACFGPRRPHGDVHVKKMQEDPNLAVNNIRQTIMDIRRAKAILSNMPQVDPHQIGITGVSMGGIISSLAAGVDGEFNRVVPILAGGDLADIIFSARETRILRRGMEAKGMTLEDAKTFLAPIDPLSFASRIAPGSCLMINAARDEVIPKATTEALNKAIGFPQILWTPMGHYSSVWYLPKIRQSAIDFIKGKTVKSLDSEVGTE